MLSQKTNTLQSDRTLQKLYGRWPETRRFLKSIGCPQEDAEDIFQEALSIVSVHKLWCSFSR